jgi:hypothetical protein
VSAAGEPLTAEKKTRNGTEMLKDSANRRPRRAVKVGIAAAVAVAASGALFASQAGAASLFTTTAENVMVKTAPGINCFVLGWNKSGGFFTDTDALVLRKYDLTQLGWKPGWNSTGVQIEAGHHVEAWVSSNHCSEPVSLKYVTKKIKVSPRRGDWGNAWLDTTS